MATLVTTQTDYTADGLAHVWTLFDDGSVTLTDGKGGTITAAPTADTVAQAAAFKATQAADVNESTLEAKTTQALAANGAYVAKTSTTTAEDKAQIKALTRQVNALIRLATGRLDDTTGT